jgi:hypothetical protein
LECKWKAKEVRRLMHSDKNRKTFITLGHRKLGVELKDVECTLEISSDEYKKDIEFPTGWVLKEKEADDADDYYGFTTSFTVRCSIASPWFVSSFEILSISVSMFSPVLQIEDDLLITTAEAELEVEIEVGEDDNGDDVLNYDSSDIDVTCISTRTVSGQSVTSMYHPQYVLESTDENGLEYLYVFLYDCNITRTSAT